MNGVVRMKLLGHGKKLWRFITNRYNMIVIFRKKYLFKTLMLLTI